LATLALHISTIPENESLTTGFLS